MEIVVFSLGALALILASLAFAVPAARAVGLPLPVVIAAVGVAYSGAAYLFGFGLTGTVLDTYDIWFVEQLALDSGSMLYIFLPPLLFEMALAVDVRRMLDDLAVVLIMAVVAVAAATLAVGFSVWTVSSLGLIACLMLGAAVATTDPAAVVTTFREIGAPRRLLAILEGESLLNDAAAIAIFTLLLSLTGAGEAVGPLSLVGGFLYSFVGGAAVGLAMSFAASRLYRYLGESTAAETSLTVALAYGVYLVAELALGASGVVAVVFAGLATGSVGFVRMGPRNWSGVVAIWSQIGFWASALILFLVATLTPTLLSALSPWQIFLGVVVFLSAFAARALVLFGALPLLDLLGRRAPIETKQKTLILWGGVRGAVTLVLALSLGELSALGDDAAIVGALAALFTLMTLFVNAATLAFATRRLGLDLLSPTDLALREFIVAGALESVRTAVADLAKDRNLSAEAIAEVEAGLVRQRADVETEAAEAAGGSRIPFGDRLSVGLTILCGQEARLVRRAFEDGAVGPRATILLRLTADRISDAARMRGRDGYAEAAEAELRRPERFRAPLFLFRWFGVDRPLRDAIEFRLTTMLETERILKELDQFARNTLREMIGGDAAENLRGALADRLDAVAAEIASMSDQFPDYAASLERTLIKRSAIRRERFQYERLFRDKVIGPELFDDLNRSLRQRESALDRPPRLDLTLTPLGLIERGQLFPDLTAARRRRIAARLAVRVAAPGEVVAKQGSATPGLVFVASGGLEVEETGDRIPPGAGFGAAALFAPKRTIQRSIVSIGFSRLLVLSGSEIAKLRSSDRALYDALAKRAQAFGDA